MAAQQHDTRPHPTIIETYKGVHLFHCSIIPFSWRHSYLIVVSGDGPNRCGHALIKAGIYYFHINGRNNRPYYMGEAGYRRYLKENGKTELQRKRVSLPNPEGAQRKLEELSAKPWGFRLFSHNCVNYVEEIFRAGGSRFNNLLNCPVSEWE